MTTTELAAALTDLIAQAEPVITSQEASLQDAFAELLASAGPEEPPQQEEKAFRIS